MHSSKTSRALGAQHSRPPQARADERRGARRVHLVATRAPRGPEAGSRDWRGRSSPGEEGPLAGGGRGSPGEQLHGQGEGEGARRGSAGGVHTGAVGE